MSEGFGHLRGLEKLRLYNSNIEALPESETHCCIFIFFISNFGNLMSEGFGQLASLADLHMACCYKLESLPEGQLLFSVCICLFLDCSAAHYF